MQLITFILACYGMTMIVVYGKIFEPVRPNHYFFRCTMCMGFWVGLINIFMIELPFNAFTAGCISSGTSYLLSRLVDDDGILIKLKKEK
jgi:hypothetical protein